MIRSMTGYGAGRQRADFGVVSVEARSVNNRHLDIRIRGARDLGLSDWEARARRIVQERVGRGRLDIEVSWERGEGAEPRLVVDRALLDRLIGDIEDLAERLGVPAAQLIGPVSGIPGAVELQTPEIDREALFDVLDAALVEAVERFNAARRTEGQALAEDLLGRARAIGALCDAIEANKDRVVERYRDRLRELIENLTTNAREALSADRLEAEVALYADRCDITEEIVRLRTHLKDFEAKVTGEEEEPVGRGLEFLVQELLRETNTIASKARDTSVVQATLKMKSEIEKIREQVFNIE